MKPKLVVVGPLPPPYHGVTVSTGLVLANETLRQNFDVEHFDTSDHRSRATVGKWEILNIWLAIKHAFLLALKLSKPKGIMYFPVSGGLPGFLRDSLLIHAARLRGWTVVGHFRNGDFDVFLNRQPGPIKAWLRFSINRLTAAAVLGEGIRTRYTAFLDRQRMTVVPNGTLDLGSAEAKPHDDLCVLYLSNLRRRKGVVESVRAASICLQSGQRARFIFAGDFEDDHLARELRAIAAPFAGSIEFRPSVSGVAKENLYRSADIFVFPPVEPEGHPRVVLEAMAAGLPVIATARGAIPETVEDGIGGIVLDTPTPDGLAASITRLLEDHSERVRMGKAARERFLESFTQERADEGLTRWLLSVWAEARGS